MELTEIAFFCDDVGSMTTFYSAFLGAKPVAQSPGMAIFMLGKTKLFLHRKYEAGEGELPPENHLAFTVEDVDVACRQLEDQGIKIETEAKDYYWGRSAYLRAPDGQLIELTQATRVGT